MRFWFLNLERRKRKKGRESDALRAPDCAAMAMKARLLAAAATCVCLAAAASAFDVPTVAFEEGFSPLFGDGNLVRARDDRAARLLLDRRSGNPSVTCFCSFAYLKPFLLFHSVLPVLMSRRLFDHMQVRDSSPRITTCTASSARPSSCPETTRPASSSPST